MCLILWLVVRCVCLSDGGIKADCDREEATFLHFVIFIIIYKNKYMLCTVVKILPSNIKITTIQFIKKTITGPMVQHH